MEKPTLHVEPGALDHIPAAFLMTLVTRWGLELKDIDGQLTLRRRGTDPVPPLSPEERAYLNDTIHGGAL